MNNLSMSVVPTPTNRFTNAILLTKRKPMIHIMFNKTHDYILDDLGKLKLFR